MTKAHAGANDYFGIWNYDGILVRTSISKFKQRLAIITHQAIYQTHQIQVVLTQVQYSASHDNTNATLYPSGSSSNGLYVY